MVFHSKYIAFTLIVYIFWCSWKDGRIEIHGSHLCYVWLLKKGSGKIHSGIHSSLCIRGHGQWCIQSRGWIPSIVFAKTQICLYLSDFSCKTLSNVICYKHCLSSVFLYCYIQFKLMYFNHSLGLPHYTLWCTLWFFDSMYICNNPVHINTLFSF